MISSDIQTNLEKVQERIAAACRRVGRSPDEITLIAATKTVGPEDIETAFKLGIRHFGENRVQEAEKKIQSLSHLNPRPTWHMIGHLQTNKVKTALDVFDVIQSVDSVNLAEAIDLKAQRRINEVPVLLEINVSGEHTKNGFAVDQLNSDYFKIWGLPQIEIRGLMTIAPQTEDPEQVRPIFRRLRELRDSLHLHHLSMGMTDDFEIAIEEGATMVRIGRAIFGERK